jgi:hypothetical protein
MFGHRRFIAIVQHAVKRMYGPLLKAGLGCEEPLNAFQMFHVVDIFRHNLPIFLEVEDIHARVLHNHKECKHGE